MATSEQKQTEALEKFKKESLENLSSLFDLDALYDVDINQLGFSAWNEFTSKWRNSKEFYLDEDPADTSTALANNNDNNEANEDTAKANIAPVDGNNNNEVAERRKGKDKIPSDHEGANNMP
ncbi:hypothetical protein GOBAR_DD00599 [Gossypium barbadense]|nr:hypothetical protein GOBAR_DD00599 [Gossypium barbadense]